MIKKGHQRNYMFSIMGTAVLLVLIGSYFSGKSAIELVLTEIDNSLKNEVEDFSKNSSTLLSKYESNISLLASLPITHEILRNQTLSDYQNRKNDRNWQLLRTQVLNPMANLDQDNIRRLYVGSALHGQILLPTDSAITNYDARKRLWYEAAVEKKGFAYTSYLTFDLSNIDVTVSIPVMDQDHVLGVVGIDLFTDRIFVDLESKQNASEIALMIDQNGQIIYHSNKKYLLKNINEAGTDFNAEFISFAKNMISGKIGKGEYADDKGEKISMHYGPVGNTGWRLGIGISQSKISERINELIVNILLVDLLSLSVLTVIVFFLTRKMVQPIKEVVAAMKNIAEGNFSGDKKIIVRSNDEMGELAKWFNTFSDSIDHIQTRSKESGVKISGLSNGLTESMSNLNAAAIQQSAAVAETTSAMEEMYQTSSKIAENANKVVEIALYSQSSAKQGVDLIQSFITKMEQIEKLNKNRTEDVFDLNKKVNRITEVVGIIRQINEQTKLIAFNAALEASGSGEAGKRFAIVASEIRRLADTVQESMEEIKLMIMEIQNQTEVLLRGTEQSTRIVLEGVEGSKLIEDSLRNIYMGTKNTTENSQQINLATEQQKAASEQIVSTLVEISGAVTNVVQMTNEIMSVSTALKEMSVDFKNMQVTA